MKWYLSLSSEVLKGYSLFLIYKTNIFVKLLKLNLMPMWLYFFIIYFCGIWAFSSSRKHLLITLLRLEFVVLVLNFLEPSGPLKACNGTALPNINFTIFGRVCMYYQKRMLAPSCPSVRRSVRMHHIGSRWTDFRAIWFWTLFFTIYKESTHMVNIGQKYWTLQLETKVRFIVAGYKFAIKLLCDNT